MRTLSFALPLVALLAVPAQADRPLPAAPQLIPASPEIRQLPPPPRGEDYSKQSLRAYQQQLLDYYGGDYRNVPLAAKAEFFEWAMWRYNRSSRHQIQDMVLLPHVAGQPPRPVFGSDTSTWNGALLAGLSYKYAVTKDPETLDRIVKLLGGLRFYSQVTGQPGCYARTIVPDGTDIPSRDVGKFKVFRATVDGESLLFCCNPAKGTYNQLAGGYATMMMYVFDDLPPAVQAQVRRDVANLVVHVVANDYQIKNFDGTPSPHGSIKPLVATIGVPFNAQVAYQIVALGYYFPADNPQYRKTVGYEFYRLRDKRHAYYKDAGKTPLPPQRIGNHPLVKGMNDRNHVTNAAFVGLALDVDRARRTGGKLDRVFMYRLGRTMYWSMRRIGGDRNSLCNFMWAGMLSDPERFNMIVKKKEHPEVTGQIERGVADGIEQLRRFRLDRFGRKGSFVETKDLKWCDQMFNEVYYWKSKTHFVFNQTGPVTDHHVAAMDYLYAYWLMRYYELDKHPAAAQHQSVL